MIRSFEQKLINIITEGAPFTKDEDLLGQVIENIKNNQAIESAQKLCAKENNLLITKKTGYGK
jgi:hypothetical protein